MNYVTRLRDELARELPDLDDELLSLYTLLGLVAGENTTLKDVHNAWAVWTAVRRPEHSSLIPFGALSAEVAELDRPYAEAIHRAARQVQSDRYREKYRFPANPAPLQRGRGRLGGLPDPWPPGPGTPTTAAASSATER